MEILSCLVILSVLVPATWSAAVPGPTSTSAGHGGSDAGLATSKDTETVLLSTEQRVYYTGPPHNVTETAYTTPETTTRFETDHQIPDWKSLNITAESIAIIKERQGSEAEEKLIDDVAVRGDALREYRIGLRNMNLLMRKHHSIMRHRVGYNLYPLILALDVDHDRRLSGVGSEYILYLQNGTMTSMKPTPVEYEINKDLAHMALAVFSIISPYFKNPNSTAWRADLKEYQDIVQANIIALNASGINDTSHWCGDRSLTSDDHYAMLTKVNNYIGDCLQKGNVSVEGYKKFTHEFQPLVQKALRCAAQMQVKASVAGLQRWKDALGEQWRDLYVVIPTIWPVARVNPRQLIFEHLMDPDRKLTHIIKAEGVTTVEEAREVLGRIVADRSMAHFVFGSSKDLTHTDSNLALSTRRDLVATYGEEVVEAIKQAQTEELMPYILAASELRYDEDGPPL